ncbi:hypothetical protein [Psychrobacillus sp. OK032]|uniref:hypothetical protein n=1 Tax=Psychrobacillus sp. OK032 TaxID=1884358 RepID=UPI0008ADE674|nr:hypothetical protein [Psychrobacillus sp. OK032]SES46825.1 hypothetical protein SAMN05518872_1411 [Psychrobacillus sp. OK032]
MERGMLGNWHVPCGVGEKLAITSNAYLLLTVRLRIREKLKGKNYYLSYQRKRRTVLMIFNGIRFKNNTLTARFSIRKKCALHVDYALQMKVFEFINV